jgi:DNA-binding transcriptional LysR family regulator
MEFSSRQLRAFLLVAQHHSFTRAADALFITPSGLSLLIRELETQLGFRLFDRTTRHVATTTLGSQLLPVARRSLDELDAAMSSIGQTAREASHTLSIGTGLMLAANVLPQAIKEFGNQRPDVRIQLFDADPATTMQKVKTGSLDMGLGFYERAPGIRRTPFFRFSLMVVRPDSEAAPRRASTTWSGLKGERLILQTPTSAARRLIDQHLAQAGIASPPAVVLNRLETIIAMVEAGQGIAVIPSFALPACRHRKVVMSRLINPTVTLDFYQIRSRGRTLPAAAEDFTSFLQNYIARWAGRAGVL